MDFAVAILALLAVVFAALLLLRRVASSIGASEATNDSTAVAQPSEPAPKPTVSEADPVEISIGPSPEQPIVRFATLDRLSTTLSSGSNAVPEVAISRLNALVGLVGPALVAANSQGNLMRVDIAGQLARAAGTDGFRAVATRGGKIVEHAVLNPTSLAKLATGAAIFQLVSIIVAQKHLADISRKLDQLQSAVAGIRDFLEDGRKAEITSTIRYLQQIAGPVLAGEFDSAIRDGLELREQRLMHDQEHIVFSLDREKRSLEGFQAKEWFGSSEVSREIEATHLRIESLHDQWIKANAGRIAALQLLSIVGAPAALVEARRGDIAKGLSNLRSEWIPAHAAAFAAKAQLIHSRFNTEKTLEMRRQVAKSRLDNFLAHSHDQISELEADIASQRQISAETDAPLSLGVELLDGKVVRAWELA